MSRDANLAMRLADSSLQDVGDSERFGDLVQVARSAGGITVDGSATNNLEVGDFGQCAENVALHAVGQKCIFVIVAKVFKR